MDTNNEKLLAKEEVFQIVGSAIEVLNALGHGLLEKPYENALALEFVSVWIYEKASIIPATVGGTDLRAFQASPADLAHEPGETIHFFTGLSPKSESRSVGLMASILGEAEKRFRLVSASRIEDSPPSARAIAGKTERWQELAIKLARALQIAYAQVNVVEVARLFHFSRYF